MTQQPTPPEIGPDIVSAADVDTRRARFAEARVLVIGLGLSGSDSARVLAALGAHVVGLDTRVEVAERVAAAQPGVRVLVPAPGESDAALIERGLATRPAFAVVAPGIPLDSPLLVLTRAAGVPLTTEFDLAWQIRLDDAPWFFVTGTNGKTSTAQMTSSLLRASGLHAPPLGNMGVTLPSVALEGIADDAGVVRAPQAWPVEIAALQLWDTSAPRPTAAVCLNVAEDHLDHFGDMATYRRAKGRVYHGVRAAAVYPVWEQGARELVEEADVVEGARAVGLSLQAPALGQLGVVEDAVIDRAFHARRHTEGVELFVRGDLEHLAGGGALAPHLITNAMAAAALARAGGVEPDAVAAGLRAFRLDAHRSAVVPTTDGLTWVNDSKATNAHAAAAALRGLDERSCVWIAGGDAKGADLDELVRDLHGRMRGVVLIGRDRSAWLGPLRRHAPDLPVIEVPDGDTGQVMTAAVTAARDLARPGDTVLLAPAGASWDQFRNYGHRGDAFASAVAQLTARTTETL